MILSVVFCITGLTYAWRKQSSAHIKIDKFLEEIQVYESELQTLRNRCNIQVLNTSISTKELFIQCTNYVMVNAISIKDNRQELYMTILYYYT